MARRAGVLATVTAAVVLSAAAPAAADVTVSPASAPQAGGVNLTFRVTNSGTAPVTEVTLRIPKDSPIAEVYPLSVDSWAPKIEWQKLAQPLDTIHGGTPVDQATSAIVWLAVGKPLAPGAATDLSVAVGPLPTLSSLRFPIETKYADGKAGPAMAATLSLTPSVGEAPAHHSNTGQAPAGELTPGEQAAFDKILQDADSGPSMLAISGWVVAALALLGAGWVVLRNRHRATTEEEPDEEPGDEDKEPVAVGAGDSKWSFKG